MTDLTEQDRERLRGVLQSRVSQLYEWVTAEEYLDPTIERRRWQNYDREVRELNRLMELLK